MRKGDRSIKKAYILFIILLFGVCCGLSRAIYAYQQHTDVAVFRDLSATQMRGSIGWLVRERSISEVKAFLLKVYPTEEPVSHGVGHLLGEEVFRKYGSRAFSMCDPMFNYGCYHGVVDMAIRLNGPQENLVDELKSACDKNLSDAGPCIHPLGHASAIVATYDIVKAFGICDRLYPEPKVAFSCWNGAMMEYINRSAPNAPQASYGSATDPYFPCNTFPLKYQASCVSMHISYLKAIWSEDFDRVLHYCQTYPSADTRTHCVDAAGSIIGQKYFDDPQGAVGACQMAGNDFSWCLNGVNVPYLAAHKIKDAHSICAALVHEDDRRACEVKIINAVKR